MSDPLVDHEQWLLMHLLKHLKPDCCCSVCEVLREYIEETFSDADKGGDRSTEGQS